MKTAPARLVLCVLLCLGFGCARSDLKPTGVLEDLSEAALAELDATPLALAVFGRHPSDEDAMVVGTGSGVLLDGRTILTAEHVVPDGAMGLVAFAPEPERREAASVERIVRDDDQETDWAVLVLETPLQSLGATPARLPRESPRPEAGMPVLLAGYPRASEDPHVGAAVLVRSTFIDVPTRNARPECLFARHVRPDVSLKGMSGGPAFVPAPDGGPPLLVGVHIATWRVRRGPFEVGRGIVIEPLPLHAIGEVLAGREGEPGGA